MPHLYYWGLVDVISSSKNHLGNEDEMNTGHQDIRIEHRTPTDLASSMIAPPHDEGPRHTFRSLDLALMDKLADPGQLPRPIHDG